MGLRRLSDASDAYARYTRLIKSLEYIAHKQPTSVSLRDVIAYANVVFSTFRESTGCNRVALLVLDAIGSANTKGPQSDWAAYAAAMGGPTIARAAANLERAGLLAEMVDPRDHRRLLRMPTPYGKQVLDYLFGDGVGGGDAGAYALACVRFAGSVRAAGFTQAEVLVINLLESRKSACVSEIAAGCGLARSTAGFALSSLAKCGLVEHLLCQDGRRTEYALVFDGRGDCGPGVMTIRRAD